MCSGTVCTEVLLIGAKTVLVLFLELKGSNQKQYHVHSVGQKQILLIVFELMLHISESISFDREL